MTKIHFWPFLKSQKCGNWLILLFPHEKMGFVGSFKLILGAKIRLFSIRLCTCLVFIKKLGIANPGNNYLFHSFKKMHLDFVLINFFPLSATEVCPPNLSGVVTLSDGSSRKKSSPSESES